MPRIAAAFVAVCMLLIAGSVGAALFLSGTLGPVEAAVVALAILITLVVYNASVHRVRDRSATGGQITDLSRGIADLARQVGDIGRRLVAAEAAVATVADKTRAATTPLSAEIAELSTLVKELAESVAAHDTAIRGTIAAPALATEPARRPPDVARVETARDLAEFGAPESERARGNRFKASEQNQLLGVVRAAIEANRVDLYLQPIVSLPQRKVRSYEATTRLRSEDGEVLQPSDFLDVAEATGLLPRVDNLILFRCVQVARRLATKNREVSLFCNISGTTLVDPEFFPQVSEFMQTNRALASSVVLQFSQSTLRGMGPMESESLAALAELGFRFSLDRVSDLKIEPREFADRSFRFVKVAAPLLLKRGAGVGTDIHPADFSDLLARYGIDLIADRIDSESTVVDLLDYDVRFGQGFLFSPPRPVRPEALQAIAESTGRRDPAAPLEAVAAPVAIAPTVAPPVAAQPPRSDRRSGMLAQLARGVVRRA